MDTEPNGKYNNIHEDFDPYVNSFINTSRGDVNKIDLWSLSIGFKKDDDWDAAAGTCYILPFNSYIEINEGWWIRNPSPVEREGLVFHEMGHCVLHRYHIQPTSASGVWGNMERWMFKAGLLERYGRLPDGCPSSYMHPFTFYESCMLKHKGYYEEELFRRVKTGDLSIEKKCKEPTINNYTTEWTERDEETFNRAKNVCKVEYKSCLEIFTKKAKLTYTASCNSGHTLENFI